ncbi:hypothetical protein [Alkalihalobacterium alkalinitrilicum]|uniref:hypothetical protein n=1 Tax=Alkalihalobacterium alkalinitrilicum TaxID=427920 RepID=UPI001C566EE9|nr:hypothetical protein [Alkalihalobacterium alkalinitrilicum]
MTSRFHWIALCVTKSNLSRQEFNNLYRFKRQIRSKEYEAASSQVAECTFKVYMSNAESAVNEVIRRLSFVEWLS